MIFEKVQELISEQLGINDVDTITPTSTLVDDLDADSLDAVEIIMAVEDEFDLEIPDEEAEGFKNVQDIIEYIEDNK